MDDYVNEGCPNECSAPHDIPPEEGGEEFVCTETDERFFWCDRCDEWVEAATWPNRQRIETYHGHRYFLCNTSGHDFYECEDCLVWLESGRDNLNEPCYNERTFCDRCWENRGGCDCDDCRPYDECYDDYDVCEEGEEMHLCVRCNTYNRHLDLMNEIFMCECAVQTILETDPEHPFQMYGSKVMA